MMTTDFPPHREDAGSTPEPEFGPRGYLPRRAANRARKIVLREEMSLGWPLAALAAGLVVLAAGVAFWVQGGAPDEPFEPIAAFETVPMGEARVTDASGTDVLLVRVPGALRAFRAPGEPVRWCADTDRLEGDDGAVWQLDGRRVGGDAESLARLPVEVHDATVYAAVGAPRPPVPPAERDERPGCTGA